MHPKTILRVKCKLFTKIRHVSFSIFAVRTTKCVDIFCIGRWAANLKMSVSFSSHCNQVADSSSCARCYSQKVNQRHIPMISYNIKPWSYDSFVLEARLKMNEGLIRKSQFHFHHAATRRPPPQGEPFTKLFARWCLQKINQRLQHIPLAGLFIMLLARLQHIPMPNYKT